MVEFAKELLPINIEDEMRQSYMDYAMSVIVGRALPDVRDGLKPVHRRVLYVMHEANNLHNRPYVKCARVVGDVMGKYHPHGDSAIYETLVRMAQDFSLRYPLVDGQGNFGSIDGDPAAAMRYTECRLQKIADEIRADLDKETVDFVPNYDGKEFEPTVLPTRIPNLLVNGSSGIAVGMATNIPPHNLCEVVDACLALIDDPTLGVDALMELVPGPDFPTAGIIRGKRGIQEAYLTGRGRVVMRARVMFEDMDDGATRLVVSELPYQVNKARLIERIAELVKTKKLEGIRGEGLRDESDKEGMRIVIELRRTENPEVFLNNLYQLTPMQSVFGINMVALVDGQPRTLSLKELIECFLRHRREVVTRRTLYELRKARERAHILEGLAVALANIDPIIALIKRSPSPADARSALMSQPWPPGVVQEMLARAAADASRPDEVGPVSGLSEDGYHLSEVQAKEILDMRLQRLTALEQDKIIEEFEQILERIADLVDILTRPERLLDVIREELASVRTAFGDERRTQIDEADDEISMEDLIPEQEMVVTLSHRGYVKAQPVTEYRAQGRGGVGQITAKTRDEDFVERFFVAGSHDTTLWFSTRGRLYWLKVYNLPVQGRGALGKPLVNLLPLESDERITAVLTVPEFRDDQFVLMATAAGTIKKTPLSAFSRPRSAGIIAIDLVDEDALIGAELTGNGDEAMLFSSAGKALRFRESDARAMGRTARGVRGLRLSAGQQVVSLLIVNPDQTVLTVTENGYGKCTRMEEYPTRGRGTQGVISIQTSDRNGAVVAAVAVAPEDEIMLSTDGGVMVRTRVAEVPLLSRNTQGVRLIKPKAGQRLIGVQRVAEADEPDAEAPGAADAASDGGVPAAAEINLDDAGGAVARTPDADSSAAADAPDADNAEDAPCDGDASE